MESLSSTTQAQPVDASPKYEYWGPLYIQETGEEEVFTQDPRKRQGKDPSWCPESSVTLD